MSIVEHSSLTEYYSEKAKEFLKTVVCIDDEPSDSVQASSKMATKIDAGFDEEESPRPTDVFREQMENLEESHPLNFQDTAYAFAKYGILCSVLRPQLTGDQLPGWIASLANSADVAILDWQLERSGNGMRGSGSSKACREAIKQILDNDRRNGGRLRLIVVFTATDASNAIADLKVDLTDYDDLHQDDCALVGSHWRIVVLQKPYTQKVTTKKVEYSNLPDVVIHEFSTLTNGLLPSAILHGITAVRENTHRLLAIFDRDLDGAFLAHRTLIPDPNEAEEFLLELFQDELGALIRNNSFKACVGSRPSKQWIELKGICAKNSGQRESLLKAITEPSKDKIKDLNGPFVAGRNKKKVADRVVGAFYGVDADNTSIAAENAKERLAQLAGFYGVGTPPSVKDIRMQLGILVRDEVDGSRYLMCLQPLCDSVRIIEPTLFPFLILDEVTSGSDIESRDLYIRLKSNKL
jgi:hypothetical protein